MFRWFISESVCTPSNTVAGSPPGREAATTTDNILQSLVVNILLKDPSATFLYLTLLSYHVVWLPDCSVRRDWRHL